VQSAGRKEKARGQVTTEETSSEKRESLLAMEMSPEEGETFLAMMKQMVTFRPEERVWRRSGCSDRHYRIFAVVP